MKAVLAQERMGRTYLAKLHPGKLPKRDHNAYARVAVYLCDLAWRVMNDRHLGGLEQPRQGELRRALRLYIDRHLGKFVRDHDDPTTRRSAFQKFRYIDTEQADYLAGSLATSLLRDWTPDWIEERVRRGHRGREVARPRGATIATADNLAALAALPGADDMTHAQRADTLGLTVATERRLWAQYRHQRALEVAEEVSEPQETPGAPSWWGGWADAPEPVTWVPAQRRYGRRIYPGERV
jgi:hypothetical protein